MFHMTAVAYASNCQRPSKETIHPESTSKSLQGEEYSYITDNTYSKQEILQMEEIVWGALNFELTVPTQRTFLRRFLKASAADWPPSHVWR